MSEFKAVAAIVSHQYRINARRVMRVAEGFAVRVPFAVQVAGVVEVRGLLIVEKRGVL